MDWVATLRRSGGINALARHVGISPLEASTGATALLLPLLGGFRSIGDSESGLQILLAKLDTLGDGNLAVEVMGPDPLRTEAGEKILGWVLESDASRRDMVAQAASVSDLEPDMVDRLLPPLAMLVGGYISARAGAEHDLRGLEGILDDPDRI